MTKNRGEERAANRRCQVFFFFFFKTKESWGVSGDLWAEDVVPMSNAERSRNPSKTLGGPGVGGTMYQ